jgi:hypothetical protein
MFDVTLASAAILFDIFNIVLIAGAVTVAIGTFGSIKMAAIKERFGDERISENEARTVRARKPSA